MRTLKRIHKLRTPPILWVLRVLAGLTIIVAIVLNCYLTSVEAKINVQIHSLKSEISSLQSEKDTLKLKEQDLLSTERIAQTVEARGLTHRSDSEVAAVMGDE